MRKNGRKIVLALILMLALLTFGSGALADVSLNIENGSIILTAEGDTLYYQQGSGNKISYIGAVTVTGTSTVNEIKVESGKHNVTLNEASIDVSGSWDATAFSITSDAKVNLTLAGKNVLKSSDFCAALQVSNNATLTITEDSTGGLEACGGYDTYGIGGGGNITINGGAVIARGNYYSAGISGTVTINGGSVLAHSECSGAFSPQPTITSGKIWYSNEASEVSSSLPGEDPASADSSCYTNYNYVLVSSEENIPIYCVNVENDGNGYVYASVKTAFSGTEITLTAYPKQGHKFKEWQVVSGGVTIVNDKFILGTSDVVIKAVFEKLTYPIIWENYDGTVLETDEAVEYGTMPTYDSATPIKPTDAQNSYIFFGWSPEVSTVTGAATYVARFIDGTYPIIWKNYDGTVLEMDSAVAYGTTPTYNGETPVRAADGSNSYIFAGWFPEVSPVTDSETYTAQFSDTANGYRIDPSLNIANGSIVLSAENGTLYYQQGEGVKTGYTGSVTITGTTAANNVVVESGVHKVILNGMKIDAENHPAINITSSAAKLTIVLKNGTESIFRIDDHGCAGIANNGADLNIYCESVGNEDHECTKNCGKLTIYAGDENPGIGSNSGEHFSGTVTIAGGEIYISAGGFEGGAAIGGGREGDFNGTVTISGGIINVSGGGNCGAGIGGGYEGDFNGTVEISGGIVSAGGGEWAAGIGDGNGGDFSGTVTITGGSVNANSFGNAGIGCRGTFSGIIDISGGNVYANACEGVAIGSINGSSGGTISISGGTTVAYVGGSDCCIGAFGSKPIITPSEEWPAKVWYGNSDWEVNLSLPGIHPDDVPNDYYEKNYVLIAPGQDPIEYAVTAQAEAGGNVSANPENGEEGMEVTLTATPNEGYRFVRWEVVSGGVTIADNKFTIGTADVVINGIFEKLTYPITWKNYDGTVLETDPAVPYGETPTYDGETPVKPDDAQYTYTFTGWSPKISPVTGEVTYTAQFSNSTNTYPITWKNYDGTVLEEDAAVPYGETPTYDGETPVKPDDAQYTYTFTGWSPAVSPVTGEVIYTAQFSNSTNTYPITWKNYDGTVLETDPAVPYGETPTYDGETPVKPDDAQYTYTFTGWSPAVSPVTGEVTYTAQFSNGTNTYPITWKNYDGTVLETDPAVPYGETPTYDGETPVKPDDAQYTYTFTGWSPAVSLVTGEVTYTAQFSNGTNTYPITWKNYDGTVLETDPAVPYGETPSYDGENPTKPADVQYTYTFTGWSPAVSPVTKEADYIAQFTATLNTYVITWKNYDGTVLEVDETVSYGIIPIYNGATPTRPADSKYTYTFKGWSPAVTIASTDCEYIAVYEAAIPDVPQTGDSMNFVLTAALAAVGMIGMTVIIRRKNEV